MNIEVNVFSESLDHSHHSLPKLKAPGCKHEFHKCTQRRKTEIMEDLLLEAQEKRPHLEDGDDHLTVRDIQQWELDLWRRRKMTESKLMS